MKKLLLGLLFLGSHLYADSISTGTIGFVLPSTNTVDPIKSWAIKNNDNWQKADTTLNGILTGALPIPGSTANTQVYSDEGTPLGGNVTRVNLVGAGVTGTQVGSTVTVTVTATGSSGGLPLPDGATNYVSTFDTRTITASDVIVGTWTFKSWVVFSSDTFTNGTSSSSGVYFSTAGFQGGSSTMTSYAFNPTATGGGLVGFVKPDNSNTIDVMANNTRLMTMGSANLTMNTAKQILGQGGTIAAPDFSSTNDQGSGLAIFGAAPTKAALVALGKDRIRWDSNGSVVIGGKTFQGWSLYVGSASGVGMGLLNVSSAPNFSQFQITGSTGSAGIDFTFSSGVFITQSSITFNNSAFTLVFATAPQAVVGKHLIITGINGSNYLIGAGDDANSAAGGGITTDQANVLIISTYNILSNSTSTLQVLLQTRTVVGYDEGSPLSGGHVQTINFVGSGVTATQSAGTMTVTINTSAGSGGEVFGYISTRNIDMNQFALINSSQVTIGGTSGYASLQISSFNVSPFWNAIGISTGSDKNFLDVYPTSVTLQTPVTAYILGPLIQGSTVSSQLDGSGQESYILRTGPLLNSAMTSSAFNGINKYLFTDSNATGGKMIYMMKMGATVGKLEWGYTSTPAGFFGTFTNDPLQFRVNDTELARFDTSGNFGINTAAPITQNRLTVNGAQVTVGSMTSYEGFYSTKGMVVAAATVPYVNFPGSVTVGIGLELKQWMSTVTANSIFTSTLPYIQMDVEAGSMRGRPVQFTASESNFGIAQTTNAGTTPDGENQITMDFFSFSPSSKQAAVFQTSFSSGGPDGWLIGSTVSFNYSVLVTSGAGAGKQISYALQGACAGNGTNVQTLVYGTSVTLNVPDMVSNMTIYDSTQSASITLGGTCFGGSQVFWRFWRNPTDGGDNLGGATGTFGYIPHLDINYRISDRAMNERFLR